MEHHLVYKDANSDKFWTIITSGKSFTVTYGKTGTSGQTQIKSFDSEEKCLQEAAKLLNEKRQKGYEDNRASEINQSTESCKKRIKTEMLDSFKLFSDEKYTGSVEPVSMIVFGATGPIVDPADYEFMGYGYNKNGSVFESVGGINFDDIITADVEDEDAYNEQFNNACTIAIEALKELAAVEEFKAIHKIGPVVFALSIEDQLNRTLGRIHPDGVFEASPTK
jgi:predicted DNA-binding WGR domain protein